MSVSQLTGFRTNIGKENYWFCWFGALIILVIYFLIFFTILDNYKRNEQIRIIENCCSLGVLAYNVISFWITSGTNRFKFANIASFIGRYIYADEEASSTFDQIRTKHIDKLYKHILFFFVIIMVSYDGIVFGSIYAYTQLNMRTTPLGIHLPYFERDSDAEFIASMSFQGVVAVYTIIASYVTEMGICTVNITIAMMPDLIRFNLTEFYDEFKRNRMNLKATVRLRNAFIQIQDFNQLVI